MTEYQQIALKFALKSPQVNYLLAKFNMRITEADVSLIPGYRRVLQFIPRAAQIEFHEKKFAETICAHENMDILLLGSTQAIEGFFLQNKSPVQLKNVDDRADSQKPGKFVQRFIDAWQRSKGWNGIWLYVSAPYITKAFARERWTSTRTQPTLEVHHKNGQVTRMVVYCKDGPVELSISSSASRS